MDGVARLRATPTSLLTCRLRAAGWLALVRLPAFDIEFWRRRLRERLEHQVCPLAFEWLGNAVAEPICIERMDESFVEETVSAYVIPMNVRGQNDDRQIGERAHDRAQVGDAGPAVYERRPLSTNEQVAVDVLPMTVFRYCEGGFVDRLNVEPVERCCSSHYYESSRVQARSSARTGGRHLHEP